MSFQRTGFWNLNLKPPEPIPKFKYKYLNIEDGFFGKPGVLKPERSSGIRRLFRARVVQKVALCLPKGSQLPLPVGRRVLAYVDSPESCPFDTLLGSYGHHRKGCLLTTVEDSDPRLVIQSPELSFQPICRFLCRHRRWVSLSYSVQT